MIEVLNPGFYSTIQDSGRIGYQDVGVPYSGVMDKQAALIANTLLGNSEEASVIEMTMTGATLKFTSDTLICLSGADMSPKLNDKEITNNKVFSISKNDVLSFGKLENGFRCYLAVLGGFKTEVVMQSRSMYSGITEQFKLNKGNRLNVEQSLQKYNRHYSSLRVDNSYIEREVIEVFKGPEFDLLSSEHQNILLQSTFIVSKNNNRMAYQLEEPIKNTLKPIITSAVLPGTVQLTPSGSLIVLMRDCQTTGGYPRVLQLKASSIDVLSQKLTGSKIEFKLL